MSNKTQLQTNNAALDSYIARINAAKDTAASLPEAGGGSGGGIETCTLSISGNAPALEAYIWYIDGSSSAKSTLAPDFMESMTVTVMKNSIFFTTNISLHIYDESVCQRLDSMGGFYGYFISGDASVETM